MASSWETRDYSYLARDNVGGEESDGEVTQCDAGKLFFDMLVQLKMQGQLSAKHVCVLSHWAKLAGIASPGDALALEPTRTGGAFSAHFDRVVGLDSLLKQDWYQVQIPCHSRHSAARTSFSLAVKPAFESVADELFVCGLEAVCARIKAALAKAEWAPSFTDHPLVHKHGHDKVLPLGLYIDGVQYGNRDSTIGFWCINLATGRRHLMAALPKRDLCRCGCGGNCSIFPVASFVEWCFAAMCEGRVPSRRHDGPWPDPLKAHANEPLGFIGVPVLLKGDWAEFASTLGFRSWGHHACPCFKCTATGGPEGSMKRIDGVSAVTEPWALKDFAAWDAACRQCEVHVRLLNKTELDTLTGTLDFDKRSSGSHGRSLTMDLPCFKLRKGDRLEPTLTYPDVCQVDALTTFPTVLKFWRVGNQTMVRFRSPLFSRRSFLLPERICVDELHTMHLGVFQDYILAVFWQAIAADVWHIKGGLPEESYRLLMVNRLRAEITRWYQQQKAMYPDKPVYELKDFRVSTLGTSDRPALHAKAAESGSLLGFAVSFAQIHKAALPRGPALTAAGEALLRYMTVTRSAPLRMTVGHRQDLSDAIVRYVSLADDAGIIWKPKQHLMVHILRDAAFFGNPMCTGTWLDESLNNQLAAVCRTAHSAVWSMRVLSTMGHAAGPAAQAAASAAKKPRLRS